MNKKSKKIFNNSIIIAVITFGLFSMASVTQAGTKVLDYGFEDWTGDADTTPGYIFTSNDTAYWADHESGTHVISSCEGRTPHGGNYFWRRNYYSGGFDDCMESTPLSENSHNNIGYGGSYGGDSTVFSSDISSNVITIRFYFRLSGDWPNDGVTGGTKFTRLMGAGDPADDLNSGFVNFDEMGDTFMVWDPGNSRWSYWNSGDMDDGEWHAYVAVYERLDDVNQNPNGRISVWVDDWDMVSNPIGSTDVYLEHWGDSFSYLEFLVNWGGTQTPSSSMAIEVDDMEVWDGLSSESSDTTPPGNPSGLSVW